MVMDIHINSKDDVERLNTVACKTPDVHSDDGMINVAIESKEQNLLFQE